MTPEEKLAKYREFVEFVKNAPVSSGVCCCGEDMATHSESMYSGHTPVDQWHYSLFLWVEELDKMERNK